MPRSASAAARSTETPAGTVTSRPSIVSVTCNADSRSGVPRSVSAMLRMAKIFREMVECGKHGRGGQPPEGTKRAVCHRLAEVAQHSLLQRRVMARDQPVDDLDAARRADPARCALRRTTRSRRTPSRSAPARPCRPCRRRRRCRRDRAWRPAPRTLRSRAAVSNCASGRYAPSGPPTCTARIGRPE